jgi:hypothetical protein
MSFHKALAGVAALTLLVTATNAQGQSPAPSAAVGTYRLATINDRPLPVVVEEEDGCRDEVVSGTLTLKPDGTWTLVHTERDVCGDKVESDEENEDGKYTLQGTMVTFNDDAGDRRDDDGDIDIDDLRTGTLSADAIAIRLQDGVVAVFRK